MKKEINLHQRLMEKMMKLGEEKERERILKLIDEFIKYLQTTRYKGTTEFHHNLSHNRDQVILLNAIKQKLKEKDK